MKAFAGSDSQAVRHARSDQQPQRAAAMGARAAPRVSQGQDKPACTWSHNPPTWAWTAGKLRTISKHRCGIIMGCRLRYHDGYSSPICQFQNTANGPRRTWARCQLLILYWGSRHHSQVCLQCGISLTSTLSVCITEPLLKICSSEVHHFHMSKQMKPNLSSLMDGKTEEKVCKCVPVFTCSGS